MRMLAEEGVPTWSADAAVIRLYEPGREAWQALRLRYGERFIPDDRSPVDRKALAAALLPSAESGVDVHELENLLHPLVLDDLERFWSGQEEAGRAAFGASFSAQALSQASQRRKAAHRRTQQSSLGRPQGDGSFRRGSGGLQ